MIPAFWCFPTRKRDDGNSGFRQNVRVSYNIRLKRRFLKYAIASTHAALWCLALHAQVNNFEAPGGAGATNLVAPYFGPNVFIFDPTMSMSAIQNQLDSIFSQQKTSEFGAGRYALLFKPGLYTNLDVDFGFYTQVIGLGRSPDDVTITGNVHSDGFLADHNATVNFWRSGENFAVVPTGTATSSDRKSVV